MHGEPLRDELDISLQDRFYSQAPNCNDIKMTREDALDDKQEDVWEKGLNSGTAKQPFVPPTASKHDRPITNVGELFVALGNPGRTAIVLFFAVSFNYFSVTSNHVVGVFFGYIPKHVCYPDFGQNTSSPISKPIYLSPDVNDSSSLVNSSSLWNVQSTVVNHHACHVTIVNASGDGNLTHYCKPGEWRYNVDGDESSSVTEWNLVCENTYLANLANTFYYVGVTIGGICVAYISDTIGRKVAILVCLYSVIILGVGIAFCQSFILFVCLRTLMGLASQALMTTSYIQIVEMFPPAHRGKAGAGIQSMWGLSMVYLSLAAWALKDWRSIQLACTAPAMLSGLYLLLMPESLRWLLSRGKRDKASHVIKRIYRFNGTTDERCLDPDLLVTLTARHKYEQQSFMDLCRSPILRKNTIIFAHVACALNFGYWGITYSSSQLVGNRYQNFFLGAVAELVIQTFNIYIVNRFGRKNPMICYFFVGAICCFVLAFLPIGYSVAASTAVATLGRLAMSGLFSAGDLYATELFPTVIRTTGVSVCVLTGRLGAMLTPQVFTLGELTFKELPLLVFGGTSLAGALLTMLLPDTSKMELADTITEAENLVMAQTKGVNKDTMILCDLEERPHEPLEKNSLKLNNV